MARLVVAVTVLAVVSSVARADIIGVLVSVEASNSQGTAVANLNIPVLPDPVPEKVQWRLQSALELRGGPNNEVIAELQDLTVGFEQDPAVDLGFQVTSGNFDTTFTITSAVVAFSTITNGTAFASAGVTLTDGDPLPGDGASLSLVAPNTGLYRASYNGGTIFGELLGAQSLPGPGTMSGSTDTGVQIVAGGVTSISSEFKFKLSADDLASGTSRFEIVPEPGTAALLCLASGALIRRRRSM